MKKVLFVSIAAVFLALAGSSSIAYAAAPVISPCMKTAWDLRASTILSAMNVETSALASAKSARHEAFLAADQLSGKQARNSAKKLARKTYRDTVASVETTLETAKVSARAAYTATMEGTCDQQP